MVQLTKLQKTSRIEENKFTYMDISCTAISYKNYLMFWKAYSQKELSQKLPKSDSK
jgi:hypothetical protein